MDKYELKQIIGSGTYSNVYRGLHKLTHEEVAIKIMKKPYAQFKNNQDLELNSLKKFSYNPCVIQIKQVIIHQGILHIVFQLLKMNLIDFYKQLKKREGRGMRQEEIKSVVFQMALSLRDIHREGYAHRDIKPENMLVTLKKEGFAIDQIKLVDFGLTKKLDRQKNTNYIATRWYRSPQLLLGMNYDYGVDIFALGCVMIEMYLGYEAFQGKDTIDQLNKQFVVLGTPTQRQWPQAYNLLKKNGMQLPNYEKINIKQNIPGTTSQSADLIEKMIASNPKNRISIEDVLAHSYFNSVRNKLPEPVKRYLTKTTGEKRGTATTTPDQLYQNTHTNSMQNIGVNKPKYDMARPPSSNTQKNIQIVSNQKRPISNYVMHQRGVSPSSDRNKQFRIPLTPQKYQSPSHQPQYKPKPQLSSKAQNHINMMALNLYKQSPKNQPTFQPSFPTNPINPINPLNHNRTPKIKQQIYRNMRVEHSPDYLIGPIHVNSRVNNNNNKLKRSGIQLTNRNITSKAGTQFGCFNFMLGPEEEIVVEYKNRRIN